MKRAILYVFVFLLVAVVGYAFFYLYSHSKTKPVVFETESAEIADLTKKTVATGSIVPRQEVEIKPKVTGVLSELYVQPGAVVKAGDPLAKIAIVPDAASLNRAESDVRAAQIAFDNAKRELERNQNLFQQGVVAEAELARYKTDFDLRRAELQAAGSNQQIVREGQTHNQGKTSNVIVTATVAGTVIDVPVKVGFSVIQSNNFNPGTTVATIADMGDMIFDGHVDESEVGKIKTGLKLEITIGALEKQTFDGTLEYIAPKGTEIDGAIQFEIKAALIRKADDKTEIRAGYSANADIVLDERKQVLAMREALVQYADKKPFVEIETTPQVFVKKDVELGLSDGIKVEIKGGITATDKIKIPDSAGPAAPNAGPNAAGGAPKGMGGKPPRR